MLRLEDESPVSTFAVDVSVLTPVLDEGRYLPQVLHAMLAQRFEGQAEFLFIDGGSQDGTQQIIAGAAERDERVRLLHNPARRTPHALNIGLRHARGAFIARMDAHTVYPPDYLAVGVERLRRGDIAWVAGPQLPDGDGRWSRRAALALGTWLGVGSASFRRRQDAELDTDTGFTGLWRRETLERVGGWDERWPVNQDGELAARIRAGGGRIVCVPTMAARYLARDSLVALLRQYWRFGQYKAKTCLHHPSSLRRSHVLAPALVMTLAAALVSRGGTGRVARAGLAVYALTILGGSARAHAREAPGVAMVLATMHVAWGSGFIIGTLRFAPSALQARRVKEAPPVMRDVAKALLTRLLSHRALEKHWRRGRSAEVGYWSRWVATGGREWPEDYARRMDPSATVVDPGLRRCLEELPRKDVSIIDVGAGPISVVGYRHPGKSIALTAVDPLADDYARLLDDAGIEPPVRTQRLRGEELLQRFSPGSFDIAFAQNALDHTVEPLRIIEEMVELVRPGGYVVLRHLPNEATSEAYRGLHQWNFDERGKHLVVWRHAGPEHDVTEVLRHRAEVRCERDQEYVVCVIRPR